MKQLIYKNIKAQICVLLTMLVLTSACRKIEADFPTDLIKYKPDRTVVTSPDSAKNITLTLDGNTFSQRMVGNILYAATPNTNGHHKTAFNLDIRLNDAGDVADYKYLNIQLPLDDLGRIPRHTKYIIDSNRIVSTIGQSEKLIMNYENKRFSNDLQYPLSMVAYPLAGQNHDTVDHWISLALEIDSLNTEDHTLSGFIDSMVIVMKTDPAKKIVLKNAEFSLYYDHAVLTINDNIILEASTLSSQLTIGGGIYLQDPNTGGLGAFDIMNFYPIVDPQSSLSVGISGSIWENISFNGTGTYVFPAPPLDTYIWGCSLVNYPTLDKYVVPGGELKIVIEKYNTNQFVKGRFEVESKELDQTFVAFIPNAPMYKINCSFAQRKL